MEVFGIIGLSMGTLGFVYGLGAQNEVAKLRKEHEALKKELKESGVIKEEPTPNEK